MSLAPNPKELFVCLSNQRFQSKIFHLPTPILSEQKKQHQKLNLFYCNYKNVIAYVKYTDAICLYQRTNTYELPVEKLKSSSTFHQHKRFVLLSGSFFFFCVGWCVGSMLVFTKLEARFPQGLAFKMCNKNTSVYI